MFSGNLRNSPQIPHGRLHAQQCFDTRKTPIRNPGVFCRRQGLFRFQINALPLLKCVITILVIRDTPLFSNSRFSRDVTAPMSVYRTIAKKVFWEFDSIIMQNFGDILPFYKLIAILRRQYHIILTASWEKIYSVLGGVAKPSQNCN